MNKTKSLLLYIVTVILLSAGFMTGCSDNPAIRMRYEAEKKLHHAQKALEKARIKPELLNASDWEAIRQQFAETSEFCMAALDSLNSEQYPVEYRELQELAFKANNQLAHLYYNEKQFDKAVHTLSQLLDRATLQDEHIIATRINLGKALQAAGQWDSALVIYNSTLEQFYPPVDQKGEVLFTLFNLPLKILQIISMTGDSAATKAEFEKALAYYQGLVTKYPDSKVAVSSHGNLARLYDESGDWEKEIAELKQLLDTTSSTYYMIKVKIADIYGKQLKQHTKALDIYNNILGELHGKDTALIPEVRYKIALVKMEQKKYTDARKDLMKIKEIYPRFFATKPLAQLAICRSFELEGNWKRAEIEYNVLIESYRGSDEAMSAYLYVADHLKKLGRNSEAKRWYADAEKYYKQLAATGTGTLLEAKALTYQADLYRKLEDWQKAADILVKVYNRFPTTDPGRRSLLKASAMYRKYLDNPKKADSLIEVFKAAVADVSELKER